MPALTLRNRYPASKKWYALHLSWGFRCVRLTAFLRQTMDFVKFLGIVIILFCGFLTSKAFFRGFAQPSRLLSEAEACHGSKVVAPPYFSSANMFCSLSFDLKMGMLTRRYPSLYDACAGRLHTQSGSMDHDQCSSGILSIIVEAKLTMQQGLLWVRLGRLNVF